MSWCRVRAMCISECACMCMCESIKCVCAYEFVCVHVEAYACVCGHLLLRMCMIIVRVIACTYISTFTFANIWRQDNSIQWSIPNVNAVQGF